MILIHTALLCEAQSFIEHYKLKKINSNPKIYSNENLLIVISGIGKENTINSLTYIFNNYIISKAFNIGIAGCNDLKVPISTLFCTNKIIKNIEYTKLISVDSPKIAENTILEQSKEKILYDMEGNYFFDYIASKLDLKDIYIFKIISDHLDEKILPKDYIKLLIKKNIITINKYI